MRNGDEVSEKSCSGDGRRGRSHRGKKEKSKSLYGLRKQNLQNGVDKGDGFCTQGEGKGLKGLEVRCGFTWKESVKKGSGDYV